MKITDGRKRGWWWARNEIFDQWGPVLKPNGLAVYLCLCRHVNNDAECWPSLQRIAQKCGMHRTTVIKNIKLLESYQLIRSEPRLSASGDPDTNVYTILEVPKPPEFPNKKSGKKSTKKVKGVVAENNYRGSPERLGVVADNNHPSSPEQPPVVAENDYGGSPERPKGNTSKETQLKETNLRNITTTTTSELSTGESSKSSSQEDNKKPTTTSCKTVESEQDEDSGNLVFDFALKDFSPEQQRQALNLLKNIPTVEGKQSVLDEFNSAYQQGTIKSPWRYLSTLAQKYQTGEFTATSELPKQRTQVQAETDLNLPSFEEAFYEATNGRGRFHYQPNGYWKWASQTHLAVYHAVENIPDLFHFDHLSETEARHLFKTAWQQVITQLRTGQSLKPIPTVTKRDPEPIPQTADRTGKGYAKFKRFLEQMNKEKRT